MVFTPTTPKQCSYQVSTSYTLQSPRYIPDKILSMQCTPTPPNQCPYQVLTSHNFWFLRYSLDKILKVKVTMARSKVKSRSHHDIAYLHPLTNVPAKYQLPTPYSFRDIAQTRFLNSRLQQGQIKVTS